MSRLETASQIAVVVLAVVILMAALDISQSVVAPVVTALVFGIVMSPLSVKLDALGLPKAVAALASLLIILIALGLLALFLEPSFQRTLDALPLIVFEINQLAIEIKGFFRGLESASEDVSSALGAGAGDTATTAPAPADGGEEGEEAASALPSVEDALWLAPSILSQITIFAGTLFFFMLGRDEIYSFIARRLVSRDNRLEAVRRLHAAERQVGRYFITISVINAGYAVVISIIMFAIGMPSPILWGIAAGLLNFILYLGPAVMTGSLLLGGLLAFDGAYSLLPAAIYISINMIEAQFVTPTIVGSAMSVNPLAIFLALVFFLWLWGPVGGVISIPLLLWVTVVSTDFKSFKAELEKAKSSEQRAA